jgi:gliding motility-associated-like protein
LNVNPAPIDPINIDPLSACDDNQDAQTGVDLTLQTAAILAQQPLPASNYTVTYYNSQTAADLGTAPIIPATNYIGTNGQTIWVRVEQTATECFQTGSFQLVIDIPLLLTTPAPMSLCDDDTAVNNQFHEFDLTLMDTIITNNLGTYTVAYYPSLLDATNNTNEIQNPGAYTNTSSAVQTLGVVVTSAQGCKSITTLDIRVMPIPEPNTDPDLLELCDDNSPGDMIETFDLTLNEVYISNADPNLTYTYFATQAEAESNTNPIADPTQYIMDGSSTPNQSVWIRVENTNVDFFGQKCFVVVEQTLQINPLPTVVSSPILEPYYGCDDNFDGIAIFDLTNIKLLENILGATQLPADYNVTFYDTAAGANPLTNLGETPLPTSYQNTTPFSQDIYIRVENKTTGCVNATGFLILKTGDIATATAPVDFVSCDDDATNDGLYQSIDLTSYEAVILGAQDPTIYDVTYYESEALAIAGVPGTQITNETTYQNDISEQDVVWIRVTNTLTQNSNSNGTNACFAITTLEIFIERLPEPVIETVNNVHTICVEYNTDAVIRDLELIATNVIPGTYTYQWFEGGVALPGETNATYTVDTALATGGPRTYTVEMTSTSPLGCLAMSIDSFIVTQSGPAVIPATTTGYVVTNAFSDNQTVTVTIEGYGTYQYSLDDGPILDNQGVFTNVTLGTHTITVWDVENGLYYNCESLVIDNVKIIDYPHFFTPNGDGYNDTWNIVGLDASAKIFIFDRYGKLLKQISPIGNGWDGTFNGYLLPSTDYWFLVEYDEQNTAKQFRAHFAMKR